VPKIDKNQFTKEEAKRIMAQRRQEKALEKLVQHDQELGLYNIPYNANPLIKDKYYVLCLKHGTKYSADYVNKLWSMLSRHCTLDFELVCLTDDPSYIIPEVKILSLPSYLSGWWCKPYMFSNDLPLKGTILYMDLDIVISNNIDKLFTYSPENWCTIRDFTRKMRPDWQKYNSSVIRFQTGELDKYWQIFKNNYATIQKQYAGDQDWLWAVTNEEHPATLFPDTWIMSWKWEIRRSKELTPGRRGERKLKIIEHVFPPRDCCITVFHGDPNPEHCEDPWVIQNWI
jgi:hypothetical protein